jgi:hypothetical protein
MTRRIKKPPVRPEVRRQWLHRHEVDGESVPQIAKKDGFDVRTVRRQIESARQEREVRETRLSVLRNAMELHYKDMCNFAEELDVRVAKEEAISETYTSNRMLLALKQHLPRSPLWKHLSRWDHALERLRDIKESAGERLAAEIELKFASFDNDVRKSVVSGISQFVVSQMESGVRGATILHAKDIFSTDRASDGQVKPHLGGIVMDKMPEQDTARLPEVAAEFQTRVVDWEQYQNLKRLYEELERIKEDLREELAVIILRRVVPGRCKYCPV